MLERLRAEITPEWTLACKTSSYLSTHLISLLQFLTFFLKGKIQKTYAKGHFKIFWGALFIGEKKVL